MGLFMSVVAESYRRKRDKAAAYDCEAILRESRARLAAEREQTEEEREIAAGFLHLVNESRGKEALVRAAVSFFQEKSGCEAVGIRLKEDDDYPYYEARGFPQEFVHAREPALPRDGSGDGRPR